MQLERRYDPLYDPLYRTSDSREAECLENEGFPPDKHQKLPSYRNMFSALPERYPSNSLRSQGLESARQAQLDREKSPLRTSSASPSRSVRSVKLRRAATSPKKPATSPALGRSASTQTPKRVVPKAGSSPLKSRGSGEQHPAALDHAKLKAVFEKALPPLSDASSLALRKQLMEAWEVAEWEGREAQIRTLQEAQLKEFEDTIKAKHAQAEGTISERLSARWAAKQGNSATAIARVEQQAARKAQQLTRVKQRDERRIVGSNSGTPEGIMGGVGLQGHAMFSTRRDFNVQADLDTPPERSALDSSAGSFGIQAYRSDAQTTQAALPHVGRKELAYIGHLDKVHQSLMAEKEARSSAAVPAAGEHPRAAQADILVVDNETSAQEQAEQELAAQAADEMLDAPASPASHWASARPDSPAAELAAELARLPGESGVAEQLDEEEEEMSAQSSQERLTERPLDERASSAFVHSRDNDSVAADAAPPAGTHSEPLYAARSSFGEPSHAVTAAAAAEVTIMTQELLNEAITTEQLNYDERPTDAREVHREGSAFGEAQEAAAESTPDFSPEAKGSMAPADLAAVQAVIESLLTTEASSAAAAHEAADMQPSDAAVAGQGDNGAKESSITAGEQQTLADLALAGGAAAIDGITGYSSHDDAGDAAHAHAVVEDSAFRMRTLVTLDSLLSGTHGNKEMPQGVSTAANEEAIDEGSGLTGHMSDAEQEGLLQSQSTDAAEHAEVPQDSLISTAPSQATAEQSRTDSSSGNTVLQVMDLAGHNFVLPVKSLSSTEEPGLARHEGKAAYEGSLPPSTPVSAAQLKTGSLANGFSVEAEPALAQPALNDPTDAAAAAEEAEEAEAKISINLQPRLEWRINAEITLQQPDGASTPQREEPVEELDVTIADGSAAIMGMESSHDVGVDAGNMQLGEEAVEAKAAA